MFAVAAAPARLSRVLGSGPELERRARRRGEQLLLLGRDDVLAPAGIEADADGTVIARLPVVDGMDLAELAATRPPLTVGQCVWLGRRVGAALAAMHAAGLVHGDVSPANVVLRDGGVTLVDTLGAVREDERGTPGFRAPEVLAGDRTEASDVYALGRLLRWAVRAEDESAVRARTVAWVAPSATARPSAAGALDALRTWGAERGIAPAAPAVAHAVRSRALDRTERIASGRWWRVRRGLMRATAVTAVIALAVSLGVGVPRMLDAGADRATAATATILTPRDSTDPRPARHATGAPTEARSESTRPQPARAAADLTRARASALSSGDADALRATVTGDGAVAASVRETAAALEAGSLRFDGLSVEVVSATSIDPDDTDGDGASSDTAQVSVVSRLSAHAVVKGNRQTTVEASEETALLTLTWVEGRWWVADAQVG